VTPTREKSVTTDVVQTHLAIYAIAFVAWVICAFAVNATLAFDSFSFPDNMLAWVPVSGILFNATGLIRPKRIELKRDELNYRPVWGRSRTVIRTDIVEFGVIYFRGRSGFVTCKTGAHRMLSRRGPRYGFGFFSDAYSLADRLEAWRRA
jgi:hypothetical protein